MRDRSSEDLKDKESDNEREGGKDQVIEREATRGTAVPRDHVEKEGRSMSRGRDETVQQKRANKVARGTNVCIQREKEQGREMRTM